MNQSYLSYTWILMNNIEGGEEDIRVENDGDIDVDDMVEENP